MPHKLLLAAALAVAFLTGVALHGSAAPASAAAPLDSEEVAFVNLLNNYRAQNGLGPVTPIDTLNAGADWMSYDMGFNNYFDHYDGCVGDCVNGHQRDPNVSRTPWTRMCTHGYCYNTSKGENIAAGFTTAQSVFDAWRNSPGHNANMLGSSYKVIGIARVYVAGAPFGYYWTNDFAGFVPAGGSATATPGPMASPTRSPTPAPSAATASPMHTPSPTPTVAAATPTATRTPAPTAVPTPTRTPVSTSTPRPTLTPRIIHDVGISNFTITTVAKAGQTVPVVFNISNWGTQSENVTYGIVATCMDGQPDKVLECGSATYSNACFGTVIVPAGKYVQVTCTVTYSSPTYHDRWRHTLTASNSTDSKPSNNTRILERHVY